MQENEYVGKLFKSNKYGEVLVIGYENSSKVTIKFLNTNSMKTVKLCHLKIGNVKDNFARTTYGVGYLGDGFDLGSQALNDKAFKLWSHMLERCYSPKYKITRPTYLECHSSEDFKCLTYFKQWCASQKGFTEEGFVLDKDILIKGNKKYSEDTCCFVPVELNNLFTLNKAKRGELPIGVHASKSKSKYLARLGGKFGKTIGTFDDVDSAFTAYKLAKECKIKQRALFWKDKISDRVFDALMKANIEITD